MDVSRIDAISPRQIDWRKLTSQEIIEYEQLGVDVPPEYLQWAKEFIAGISANDNDETTYEMAHSGTQNTTSETDTNNSTDETQTEDTDSGEVEPTEAQAKRAALIDAGVSLRSQAKIFTKDSKEATKELIGSIMTILTTEKESNNEIASLESYMNKILSEAERIQNELKSEVDKINNDKSDKNTFGKINRLEAELERYGTEAQANIIDSEVNLNVYDATLNAQSENILHGADFGAETIGVGNELLDSIGHNIFRIYDFIVGRKAVKTGDRAVKTSEATAAVQTEALNLNTENLAQIPVFKSEVQDKTGVAGVELSKETDNNTNQETKDEGEKTGAVATTETDKVASGNLDQILQAKIKKGETTEA